MSNSSEQALNVIETHIGEFSEDDAFLVADALSERFGWKGTMMTDQDIRTRITDYYEFPLEPEQVDSLVSAVKETRSWSKYMVGHMGDESDVTDHIADLLLWAHGAGFDVASIISSAEHHFRHESDDRCGQCDLLLGEDMVLQEDGSYFCQDCDVSLEVG